MQRSCEACRRREELMAGRPNGTQSKNSKEEQNNIPDDVITYIKGYEKIVIIF
ncbi:hypothetical protein MA16_Dca012565 [Dendrobium catenatum]|uniref:Uncharacterized protein n=1 Tax=Dendrobium catenatum TaxID=906689 RepID=A0A2I0VKN6_9ASPA|nr:hypothetical protein MA16_Dca012565 [Dendrobium catenatum]